MICKKCGEYHPTSMIEGKLFVHSCIGFIEMIEFDKQCCYDDCLDIRELKEVLKQ